MSNNSHLPRLPLPPQPAPAPLQIPEYQESALAHKRGAGKQVSYLPPAPWGETDKDFKERIVEEGNWRAFLLERACYRYRGLGIPWSNRFAQQHFPPPDYPVNKMKTNLPSCKQQVGALKINDTQIRRRVMDQIGIANVAGKHEFKDRDCSFADAMDWVAENLGIKVTKVDAPSRMAWSIYKWASSHPSYQSEFYRLYLSRRYKPETQPEADAFDPTIGLSAEVEDVGMSNVSVSVSDECSVSDALSSDSNGSAGESEVASGDDLSRF